MKFINNIGFILLAVYLIIVGLIALIPGLTMIPGLIIGIIAIAAGVCILIGK